MGTDRKKKIVKPLSDRLIWIIGPRRLQNELLASFLRRKTGFRCSGAEDVSHVTEGTEKTTLPVLLLFDCLETDLDDCLAGIGSDHSKPYLVALFNVRTGLGIEERAMKQGVRGFFYEKDPLERFAKGVRAISGGELWVSREIMTKCILEDKGRVRPRPRGPTGLTAREVEILSMIATGSGNGEISEKLCISTNTVKTHVYNIFQKIHVPNRLQAALWAAKNL